MKMSKAGRPRLELRLRYSIEWGVRMYSMYIGYLHTHCLHCCCMRLYLQCSIYANEEGIECTYTTSAMYCISYTLYTSMFYCRCVCTYLYLSMPIRLYCTYDVGSKYSSAHTELFQLFVESSVDVSTVWTESRLLCASFRRQ